MESELVAICHRWVNLVRLHQHHSRIPTWADPDLPAFLGTDYLVPLSLTPKLWALLEDAKQPEEPFPGFSTTEKGDHPSPSPRSAVAGSPPVDHNYTTSKVQGQQQDPAPVVATTPSPALPRNDLEPKDDLEPNSDPEPSQAVVFLPSYEGQAGEVQAPDKEISTLTTLSSQYVSHGMVQSQDQSSDRCPDPSEMTFAHLIEMQIQIHDLQAVVTLPKGPLF